jgi:ribonuclease HI
MSFGLKSKRKATTMSTPPVLRIHTDGASRGNPGKAAYGYVMEPEDGEAIEEAGCLGTMTNNQAEYTALVRALEHALELGSHHSVLVHSDSELLVKQMNGEYRVKNEDLRDLFSRAQELRRRFDGGVTIRHVRRRANSRADALCNEVLDGTRPSSVRDIVKPQPQQAKPVPAKATATLEEQALRVLATAARAWQQGAAEPGVEAVWRDLVDVLKRHHVKLQPVHERDGRTTG